jgi:hypothetical protein
MMNKLLLRTLEGLFGICRLHKGEKFPEWAMCKDSFYSITETSDEISVVCLQEKIPVNIKAEKNWKAIKVEGLLHFSLTGILMSLVKPLAEQRISVCAISTYETDYLFVKQERYELALRELRKYFNILQ